MNIKELTMKSESKSGIVNIPFNLIGNAKIIEKSDGRRIIAGYANIAVVDSQNQLIPVEALKDGLETLMNDPAYANLMLIHKNIQIGKIIESFGEFKTHVDDKGLYIVAEIRKDIKTADKIWDAILEGEYNGFSIGCEVLGEPSEVCDIDGENCIEVLNDINIFEVSICSQPVNEMSGFVVVSKSKYEDEFIDNSDVCSECNLNKDTMKKKVKSEVKEEEVKEEEKTESSEIEEETNAETREEDTVKLSVEERIENLERSIFNIEAAISKIAGEEKAKKEPEEEEEEEEEEKKEEKKTEESEVEEVAPPEEKSIEQAFVTKEDFDGFRDELTKSIEEQFSKLFEEKKEKSEKEELEMAVKSRDDKIAALEKRIEVLTKSKEKSDKVEQKTIQDESEEEVEIELDDDYPITIKDGTITRNKFM